jgi:curved DNA-binding protein CbpA
MGSHSWVRDDSRKRKGVSHVAGAPVVLPLPKKKKLVWSREGDRKLNGHDDAHSREVSIRMDDEKLRKLKVLRAKIAEKEQELRVGKSEFLEENDRVESEMQNEERLRNERRKRLDSSFAEAFESAKEAVAADIKACKQTIQFADDSEIKRILNAKSDYMVLGLSPGVDGATVRKRYRQIAITVHPDKCKHPNADQAFHRIVKAYRQLSKYIS